MSCVIDRRRTFADVDFESYLYVNARREAFSRWLSYAASHQVDREVQSSKVRLIINLVFLRVSLQHAYKVLCAACTEVRDPVRQI